MHVALVFKLMLTLDSSANLLTTEAMKFQNHNLEVFLRD